MGKYFEKQIKQYGLSADQIAYITAKMIDGLEIMTKKQIVKCIEDHIEMMGV